MEILSPKVSMDGDALRLKINSETLTRKRTTNYTHRTINKYNSYSDKLDILVPLSTAPT